MMSKTERTILEDFFKDFLYGIGDADLTQFISVFNDLGTHYVVVDKRNVPDSRWFVIECAQRGRECRYLTIFAGREGSGSSCEIDVNPIFSREIYMEILDLMFQTIDKILTNS